MLGAFFGVLPGTGPAIASFSSYMLEKKLSKDPSRFGKGAIEGVAGPESANNADAHASSSDAHAWNSCERRHGADARALMIHGIAPGRR